MQEARGRVQRASGVRREALPTVPAITGSEYTDLPSEKGTGIVKKNLYIYALVASGKNGPFHSVDFPIVWKSKAAARRYKKEIVPPVMQPNYQIVKFVAVP